MAEETTVPPKAAAKKEKAPAPEDKPFKEFIEQEFLPKLKDALGKAGVSDINLSFTQAAIAVSGLPQNQPIWQVIGEWTAKKRKFNLYFPDEDIKGQKAFSYTIEGRQPSTLESFMIDERKVTCDLMVLYTLQRLNGQKWLTGN
jgi:hypothetical protein